MLLNALLLCWFNLLFLFDLFSFGLIILFVYFMPFMVLFKAFIVLFIAYYYKPINNNGL